MSSPNLLHILQATFGFSGFRANQQTVCEAVVAGRDALLVMPTGAGKSLCYQLPAIARSGTALVVSPLIALMDDQANKLAGMGLKVGRIHSGMEREASRQVCRDYLDGHLQFLFIAPERLRVPGFAEMLAKRPLSLIAIDEAHCISQWGHDFRPDYRNLARHIAAFRPAPVIALTATATPQVQRDIVAELALGDPALFIHGFRRHNLAVEVVDVSKPRRNEMARRLLADPANRPAIVYAPSRKEAEATAADLNREFPAAAYHAGLDPETRDRVQRSFLSGETEVVVATIAFGMGIDKADVRTVIHIAMPASVESYYQEIGRAGRDGLPARTVLLHSYGDRRMQDFFLEKSYPGSDQLARIAAQLRPEPIHADDLRIQLKMGVEDFGAALDKLLAHGAAEMDFGGNVRVAERTGATAWRTGYEAQVNFRRGQIEAMVRFATGSECRMAALVRHFGDASDANRTCGICDYCSPERAVAQPYRAPTRDEQGEMRRILRALAGVSGKSTGKLHAELYPKQQMDRREMDGLLDALTRAGYISLESATFTAEDGREVNYRRACITHEGREVDGGDPLAGITLREAERDSVGARPKAARKPRTPARQEADMVPLNDAQKRVEASLRAWRAEAARQIKQPAFCVFSDRVLRELAVQQPRTLEELEQIHGMGPAKVERFGEGICAILATV